MFGTRTILLVFSLALLLLPYSAAASVQSAGVQSLNLECPLPEIGQNLTTAYAFYFKDGAPKQEPALELSVTFNQTTEQLVGVVESNAKTGKHTFLFETLEPGSYRIFVQTADGSLKSNTCPFVLFGKEPTKVPELSLWAVFLVALSAFLVTRDKKR